MKSLILLHSATGNTRLITRYAASCITSAGHACRIHDIVAKPKPPALGSVDLLGVACPTMYFRPTFAMERFVARLPSPAKPKPVFLLGTSGGEPGAHFSLLAEQLAHKGLVTVGAHWVIFPASWPPQRAVVKRIAGGAPYGAMLAARYPALLPLLAIFWPAIGEPGVEDRDRLKRFIDGALARATAFRPEDDVPSFTDLHKPMPGANLSGRMFTSEMAAEYTAVRILPERCTGCGVCLKVCPVGCITRGSEGATPAVGRGCTGCWACFQHCPDRAVAGWKVGPGEGLYPGPSRESRELFRPIPS